MRRAETLTRRANQAVKLLVGLACLTTLACDNSMNFNPAAPEWPDDWQGSSSGAGTVQIDGVLQIQGGACLEATILFDGQEVAGARTRCPDPAGCARMDLEASLWSAGGHHTIAFQVLRQSQEILDYQAEGTAVVSRDNVNLGGVALRLGPAQATLEAGGAVSFDVSFFN